MISCNIKGHRRPSLGGIALGLLSFITLFFVMRFPDVAIEYMQRGLGLSVRVVIPSLFPFMVVSELIVLSGAASCLEKPLGTFSRVLFGIGGRGATAFLLGLLCGFPIGTRAAVSLYKRGDITLDELQRLVCFSNNPSSAFVISAVGTTLFGCRKFGVVLYFITVLTAVMIGVGQNIFCPARKESTRSVKQKNNNENAGRGIAIFSRAVNGAALSMLSVCAFVVFFSTFTGTLGGLVSYLGLGDSVSALIFSFFELTSGAAAAACTRPIGTAVLIAALAVGWSGLSVHFQVISICDGLDISLGRYFFSKLVQAALNLLLVWVYFALLGDKLDFEVQSVAAVCF